jgi:hypothetical protein
MLNPKRRPKRILTEEEKNLICRAMKESKVSSAVFLELYVKKYFGMKLPRNQIHSYLLETGMVKEGEKKKRQRKYGRHQRDHSFSFWHMDWHESRVFPGKLVATWEDDASRLILAGGEFDNTGEDWHAIILGYYTINQKSKGLNALI